MTGIIEGQIESGSDLAGDSTHREGVAAVGRHGDVERLLAQAEQRGAVIPHASRIEHHDSVVILAKAQLTLGANHAVGYVTVGLTGGDAEVTGKDGARERHHDMISHGEVARPAHDPAHATVLGPHVDLAPTDRLLEFRELLDGVHSADDQRPCDITSRRLHRLDLESGSDEALGDRASVDVGGKIDHFPQPLQGDAHQTSTPKARLKRMSPSTMSRMSVTPWRNISVRSTPIPKANPE